MCWPQCWDTRSCIWFYRLKGVSVLPVNNITLLLFKEPSAKMAPASLSAWLPTKRMSVCSPTIIWKYCYTVLLCHLPFHGFSQILFWNFVESVSYTIELVAQTALSKFPVNVTFLYNVIISTLCSRDIPCRKWLFP